MKKVFTILIAALSLNNIHVSGYTQTPNEPEELILNTNLDFNVQIEVGKVDPSHPKTPILMPRVQQNGHTLYIISGCNGSTLVVLDEYGSEAFSTSITEDNSIVIIPNTISGSCELQIRRGAYCFYALIEL